MDTNESAEQESLHRPLAEIEYHSLQLSEIFKFKWTRMISRNPTVFQAYPSENGPAPSLSKAEAKKLEQLTRENEALGKQIEEV